MPAALRLHLTDDARAEVAQCFETTRDAETRLRYQMVLLAADGRTAPQIAPVVRRSAATVERVVHRYREEGAAGVDMGRNIFQSEAPVAMIQAVRKVVHERLKPQHAYDFFQTLRREAKAEVFAK